MMMAAVRLHMEGDHRAREEFQYILSSMISVLEYDVLNKHIVIM